MGAHGLPLMGFALHWVSLSTMRPIHAALKLSIFFLGGASRWGGAKLPLVPRSTPFLLGRIAAPQFSTCFS
jgi:hypothetical protein